MDDLISVLMSNSVHLASEMISTFKMHYINGHSAFSLNEQ